MYLVRVFLRMHDRNIYAELYRERKVPKLMTDFRVKISHQYFEIDTSVFISKLLKTKPIPNIPLA